MGATALRIDSTRQIAPEDEAVVLRTTVVDRLCWVLAALGVRQVFAVSGSAIAAWFDAVPRGGIQLFHAQSEMGATLMAHAAHAESGLPTLVLATSGPGLTSTLTGLYQAGCDGAKVILLSGVTNAAKRGRGAVQETSSYTVPLDLFYASNGTLFDFATKLEDSRELFEIQRRLEIGLARPLGQRFVAHIAVSMDRQLAEVALPWRLPATMLAHPVISARDLDAVVRRLSEGRFVIVVGAGAEHAWMLVRRLAEKTGAPVTASRRARGLLSESHALWLGALGGEAHERVMSFLGEYGPRNLLILGSRLGEGTTHLDPRFAPADRGLIQIDLDPRAIGTAFPEAQTIGVVSEIGGFLELLIERLPAQPPFRSVAPRLAPSLPRTPRSGAIRPEYVMGLIQRRVLDDSDALLMVDLGKVLGWADLLRVESPRRLRTSPHFGAMGFASAGVVGAAVVSERRAVALCGDGAMRLVNEISCAAQYRDQANALWIVFNDGGYHLVVDGHKRLNYPTKELTFPRIDFAALARAFQVGGETVTEEHQLDAALRRAMKQRGPWLVDIHVDPEARSPMEARFESANTDRTSAEPSREAQGPAHRVSPQRAIASYPEQPAPASLGASVDR